MKKNKLLFLAAILLALPLVSLAQEQDCMVLYLDDGTETKMELVGIDKVTFGETTVSVVANEGYAFDATAEYTAVRKIAFNLVSAGVNTLESVVQQLVVAPNPVTTSVWVKGYNPTDAALVTVWSVSGQLCRSISEWDGSPIDVSALPQGIYFLKINGKTLKFAKS